MSDPLGERPALVLIVEDEKLIRRFVRSALEDQGYRFLSAYGN